ncbi:MAG: hypothetical protein MI746_06025 [Pseudomonadales bacterium]|nr:hypothetical protein [Pseudomonadales bacterium]
MKITIFFRYQKSLTTENFALLTFFVAVFIWNLVELIGLDGVYSRDTYFLLFLLAYCSIVFVVHAYLCIALENAAGGKDLSKLKTFLNVMLGYLVISIIFDRGMIADIEPNGFTFTKIPGDRYWIFQLYFLGGIATALTILVRGMLKLGDNLSRARCLVILIATIPSASVGVSVVLFQAIGLQVTSSLFQSLGFTLMLGILVYAEEKSRLFRLLTFIPFTKERRLHKKIMNQVTTCIAINDDPSTQQPINLKQMMREFEGLVVEHVLEYYQGNQKLTASALGVSEATISRRARAATTQSSKSKTMPSSNNTVASISLADECLQQSSVRITE